MAHKFDDTATDPYSESVHALAQESVQTPVGLVAEAEAEVYDPLSAAIVASLGDIAAHAFKQGLSQPEQMQGVARAVRAVCESVFSSYRGEVDPEPALKAFETDPRLSSLPAATRQQVRREIEKTRTLEHALLDARRLPQLVNFLGSLGLRPDADSAQDGTLLVGRHPTPTAPR